MIWGVIRSTRGASGGLRRRWTGLRMRSKRGSGQQSMGERREAEDDQPVDKQAKGAARVLGSSQTFVCVHDHACSRPYRRHGAGRGRPEPQRRTAARRVRRDRIDARHGALAGLPQLPAAGSAAPGVRGRRTAAGGGQRAAAAAARRSARSKRQLLLQATAAHAGGAPPAACSRAVHPAPTSSCTRRAAASRRAPPFQPAPAPPPLSPHSVPMHTLLGLFSQEAQYRVIKTHHLHKANMAAYCARCGGAAALFAALCTASLPHCSRSAAQLPAVAAPSGSAATPPSRPPPLRASPSLTRYTQGTDMLELCAASDFPACLMMRRMLEHMLGLSKQVGTCRGARA